jgi:hypothetical protein
MYIDDDYYDKKRNIYVSNDDRYQDRYMHTFQNVN